MKKFRKIIIPVFFILLSVSGCKTDDAATELTTIDIEDPVRHYSPVVQGEEQDINIRILNTGENLLRISKVYPSCGCTIAKFPETAIAPGKAGIIELKYNSNKNIGYVGVYTTIVTNTKEKSNTVFFDLNVVPDADYIKDYEELYFEEHYEESAPIEKINYEKPVKRGYTIGSSETL